MARGKEHSKKSRHILKPVLGATLMAYFAYHAVQGDRGLLAWWQLHHQMQAVEVRLVAVKEKKAELEHRISLFRPESIDQDMLDERTRSLFAYARPDELIIIPPSY